MLPKPYRLQDSQEVEKVKKEGKLYQSSFFGLLVLKRTLSAPTELSVNSVEGSPSRFCFIVSTKLSKKATKRNRAKRVLSEAVRGLLPEIKPGFNGIFLGKKSLIGKNFSEIQEEINKIFCKSGMMLVE